MNDDRIEHCTNCHYARILKRKPGHTGKAKGHDRLRCQYNPPEVLEDGSTRWGWVGEYDSDWCGKWTVNNEMVN